MIKAAIPLCLCMLLTACTTKPIATSTSHIREVLRPVANIPEAVQQSATLLPPKPRPKVETYSVTVYKVAVQSLLFALARDAKLNVDIHHNIDGYVTLNALNQTLPQLLNRIAKQVDMRYELDGPNLIVLPDSPVLRNYKIDYVNIARNTTSNVSIATQISTTGGSATVSGAGNNNSTTSVSNVSNNNFWETLVQNIKDILRETDKIFPDSAAEASVGTTGSQNSPGATATTVKGGGAAIASANASSSAGSGTSARRSIFREAASVIVNAETGLIAVRATGRQHDKIQEFLDLVLSSSKRQVLIEATVVEVQLNDQYQQGINWSALKNAPFGPSLTNTPVGAATLPSGVAP
ncbi:MAG: type II and III secretion system protein, partial [Glaciimonas sp.]|nr:type II and III secretion system protein [Glaciimonas sp.]